jgi:hypothetical protein
MRVPDFSSTASFSRLDSLFASLPVPPPPECVRHVETLIMSSSSSPLIETMLSVAPSAFLSYFMTHHLFPSLSSLAVHPVANFLVQRALQFVGDAHLHRATVRAIAPCLQLCFCGFCLLFVLFCHAFLFAFDFHCLYRPALF